MTASIPCRNCGRYTRRLSLPVTDTRFWPQCRYCGRDLDAAALAKLNALATDPKTAETLAALDRAIDETRRPTN